MAEEIRVKRILGLLLVLIGLSLLLMNKTITGSIISIGEKPLGFGGLIIVVVGVVLIFMSQRAQYESYVKKLELESKLKKILGERYERLSPEELNTYLKSYRRYEEKVEKEKRHGEREALSRLEFESLRTHLLDNKATECLDRDYIPSKRKEIIGIAKKCGYSVIGGKGKEGYVVRTSSGRKITTIGKHPNIKKNVVRKILMALASGEFVGKKSA